MTNRASSFNPYAGGVPFGTRRYPQEETHEEIQSLPYVEVPARGQADAEIVLQVHFKATRFCLYADDASKLRVALEFGGRYRGGTSSHIEMPAGLFSDGPLEDKTAFVLHCSECGAPTKEAAPKCSYCGAPFTWRITETALGQAGLALHFPTLAPGMTLQAKFRNRGDKPIGVDAAFVGLSTVKEWG